MNFGDGFDRHGDGDVCIICGKMNQQGIHIITQFICESCEAEIVNTEVIDAKYPHFIRQLRGLWFKQDA